MRSPAPISGTSASSAPCTSGRPSWRNWRTDFWRIPGGAGTLEEFFEVWTWAQLGIHRKPCGVLNIHGYFDGLLTFLDHAVTERFLRIEHRAMVLVDEDADRLLERFEGYRAPAVAKWIERNET